MLRSLVGSEMCIRDRNTTVVRSTNKSPYEIVFGQKPNLISTLLGSNEVNLETIEEIVQQDDQAEEDVDFGLAEKSFHRMQHHEEVPVSSQSNHTVPTSPTRKRIRNETLRNLEENAEMMSHKYSNVKRIRVIDFKINDHVGVEVPKDDRHSTDMLRLPCCIIGKTSGTQPTYRLMSEYGILKKNYSARSLMPYSGKIKIPDDLKTKISLREAARRSSGFDVVFCHCKAGCDTNRSLKKIKPFFTFIMLCCLI